MRDGYHLSVASVMMCSHWSGHDIGLWARLMQSCLLWTLQTRACWPHLFMAQDWTKELFSNISHNKWWQLCSEFLEITIWSLRAKWGFEREFMKMQFKCMEVAGVSRLKWFPVLYKFCFGSFRVIFVNLAVCAGLSKIIKQVSQIFPVHFFHAFPFASNVFFDSAPCFSMWNILNLSEKSFSSHPTSVY